MKISKIIMSTLIMAVMMSIFSGCWNYREIDSLLIVAGIAIDKGTDSKYHLTCDAVNVSEGSSKQAAAKSLLIECDGDTIFDALRHAVKVSDKKLYYSDCQIMVISKQLAEEGIAPVLDLMNRDAEPRIDIDILISRENTAQDVIKPKGLTNPIVSYETDKTVENDEKSLSEAAYVPLYMANNLLAGEGVSLVAPAVSVRKNMDLPVTTLDGTAVFKMDKLVGFLDSEESKMFLIVTNGVKGGLFLVREESENPDISLEIKNCKAVIKPICNESIPRMKIEIQMTCALGELQTMADYETVEAIKKIESDAETQLQDAIKQLVAKVQTEFDSDIFGFGNKIFHNNFKYWEKIKPEWDSMFRTLEADVQAEVKIIDTATAKSKIKVGE